jgi:hypothetical protein
MVQASATLVVLTTGLLAGVLRLLAGLLAPALLLAGLMIATLVLTALLLATLVLAALVLAATLLVSALAGIVVLGVLIHHVLSCCPYPTIKWTAKQRFQS